MASEPVIFYHAPNTRSFGIRVLLEELGAPYELKAINIKKGDQRKPEYLSVNPMGKVPAIFHNGGLVTEQAAIIIYLADEFSKAGLAPAIGDPLRGPYLRWIAFYAGCFEPAVVDAALKHPPAPVSTCPYGDYDTMIKTLTDQMAKGPYILGERFSAADILWGSALRWTSMWKLVPDMQVIAKYIVAFTKRDSVQKVLAMDVELAEIHEREAESKAA